MIFKKNLCLGILFLGSTASNNSIQAMNAQLTVNGGLNVSVATQEAPLYVNGGVTIHAPGNLAAIAAVPSVILTGTTLMGMGLNEAAKALTMPQTCTNKCPSYHATLNGDAENTKCPDKASRCRSEQCRRATLLTLFGAGLNTAAAVFGYYWFNS